MQSCKEKKKNKEHFVSNNIMVAVRIRPINDIELSYGCTTISNLVEENMVCLLDPMDNYDDILRVNRSREKTYVFDQAFGPYSTQNEVYTGTTKVLIDSVLEGYNATIFAYGPTGAGKTYTMLGTDTEPGIMVLSLNDLYKKMERTKNHQKYSVKMSYLEIYNEMIRDLLCPSSDFLDLREDNKGVQVAGLTEYNVLTTSEIMEMLSRGNKQRMCEPTAVNKTSSRSHAVLQVTVKQQSRIRNVTDDIKVGKLFLIDLAGSERAAQTQNTGKRLIEGAHINRSLLALGNCINALADKGSKASTYINYRDSKLTRLLKDSLGGNCKTVMIAHISPASMNFEESKNTLTYADRAKNIKLKTKCNQYNVSYHVAQYQEIISELREEINRLKTQLVEVDAVQRSSRSTYSNTRRAQSGQIMEKLKSELKSTFQEQLELRKEIIDLEDSSMQYSVEYQRQLLVIDEWEQEEARRYAKETKLKTNKQLRKAFIKPKKFIPPKYGDPYDIERKDMFTEKGKDAREPADVTIAREELLNITQKQEEIEARRMELSERLDQHKKEKTFLEEEFPNKVSNEEQRELLKTLCKIHKYEIKNIELESVALMREYLLQQKDLTIQRDQMRHKIVDEIVDMQRNFIKESKLKYPFDLDNLYAVYKQQANKDISVMSNLAIDAKGIGSRIPSLPLLVADKIDEKISNDGSVSQIDERNQTKKKWADNHEQEIITTKGILMRSPFPLTSRDSVSYQTDSINGHSNNKEQMKRKKTEEKPTGKAKNTNRRMTYVLQDDGTILQDHLKTTRLSPKNSINSFKLQKGIIPNRILSHEHDTQSLTSLATVGTKETNDDGEIVERKRSASVGMIREKQSYGKLSYMGIHNKKKLKPLTDSVHTDTKPGWNSNFNSKSDRGLYISSVGMDFLLKTSSIKGSTERVHGTKQAQPISHYNYKHLGNNDKILNKNVNSKVSPRADISFIAMDSPVNDNLAVNGTSFIPTKSQPGFRRK